MCATRLLSPTTNASSPHFNRCVWGAGAEGADLECVGAAFARLRVRAGATLPDYLEMARTAGFAIEYSELRSEDIKVHYDKLSERLAEVVPQMNAAAVTRISDSLGKWRFALSGGHITWGCLVARKPN